MMTTATNGTAHLGEQQRKAFDPREHLMQLKSREGSKDYLPVQWRLVWFREKFPHGSIETELVHLDLDREVSEEVTVGWEDRKPKKAMKVAKGYAVFRATVKDGEGGIATGTGSEAAVSFSDWLEKAETKAVGRALAALGFGTAFAPEFDEQQRGVDAPIAMSLGAQIGQAKKRAHALGLASNAQEWQQILKELTIEEIRTQDDLIVLNEYLGAKERGEQ